MNLKYTALLVLLPVLLIAGPVQIDFFYEPGCRDCEQIEQNILPQIENRFGEQCEIVHHDIGVESNLLYMLKLEHALGHPGPERSYLIVNKQFLFGPNPSREEFLSLIADLVGQASLYSESLCPSHAPEYGKRVLQSDSSIAEERFSTFTVGAVIVAGLLDGLNPCAVSTLVFFMSLLTISGIRNRQMIVLGCAFCLASFLTYLVLGFGFLRALHLFAGFTAMRAAIEWGMAAILLILAVLSLRDALRFRRSRDAHDVTLQLSTGMKKRIHRIMRRGLGASSLILGGALTGVAVTALESVCTGQVYVPTLVLILKESGAAQPRAWALLLLYNFMFIIPLAVVFIAVTFGLRTETLLAWSRRNVVSAKLLLSLFFVLMAVLVLFI